MTDSALDRDIKHGLAVRTKRIPIPLRDPAVLIPQTAPDLFSNDYLSLSTNEELRRLFLMRASSQSRVFGSTGARLLTGNSKDHVNFELRLAKFFNYPSALVLNSGYDANVAFFSCVPGPDDVIIFDELIHASAVDGLNASRLPNNHRHAFIHNSVSSFEKTISHVLERHPQIRQGKATLFVALETLYSMDGDVCPLLELLDIAEARVPKQSLHVVIDEAHATGLLGPQGRGYISLVGAERRVHSVIHTFGKARAFTGAAILSSHLIRHHIATFGRPFIYTTAMPFAHIIALNCSFDFLESSAADELRAKLWHNSEYFYRRARKAFAGYPEEIISLPERTFNAQDPFAVVSPITPLYSSRGLSLQTFLRDRGYPAQFIPYPMVPKGSERMRVVVHASNTEREIDHFIAGLRDWAHSELEQSLRQGEITMSDQRLEARL